MEKKDIISIEKLCAVYEVPSDFVKELIEFELIDIVERNDEHFIKESMLPDIEKMMNLRYELNINPEGISVIHNLLQRIDRLEEEIRLLRNRLSLYE